MTCRFCQHQYCWKCLGVWYTHNVALCAGKEQALIEQERKVFEKEQRYLDLFPLPNNIMRNYEERAKAIEKKRNIINGCVGMGKIQKKERKAKSETQKLVNFIFGERVVLGAI